jgi:hypothetical protein
VALLASNPRLGRNYFWDTWLIVIAASFLTAPQPAMAAGVVGNGTAVSCTEAALDAALVGGGNIAFNCGSSPVTITVTSQKTITANTSIDGGSKITLSGGNSTQVFHVNSGVSLAVSNLTVANGWSPGGVGGVSSYGIVTITNSTFSGNSGDWGGAIGNYGTLTVNGSTFSGNSAMPAGGAIFNYYATVTITGSTFSGNSAWSGGAIGNYGGSLAITNSTFSGNSASSSGWGGGGAIYTYAGGTMTVTNSTFSGNSAVQSGGAINVASDGGATVLRNSIVANSTSGGNCSGTITNGGNNIEDGITCGWASNNDSMSNADPKLAALADNGGPTYTMALLAGSPALGAANPSYCPATDQRGVMRPQPAGTICDIGAYESNLNSIPTLNSISPSSATAGGSTFTLTVNGTNFVGGSVVKWNGANRTTTYVSSTQLPAAITAADIATAGTASVTVFNPAPGGGTSNAQTFTINNPVPTTTSISPLSATAGGAAFNLTVNGTNFVNGSTVRWSGSARTTTYVSGSQLTAAITTADIATAGTASVTVFNPTPGGGTSNAQIFTINNPAPAITSLSPSSATADGGAFTLTVNGTSFVSGSIVKWNGSDRTTTYVSGTQLTAAITAADIATAGTASVTVFNPTPGGGTSNAQMFTINNPTPTTTSLSPSSATAGGAAFTLTVNGTNFVSNSVVRWNGSDRTTTYVSSTQLTTVITAADIAAAGTASVTVGNPAPGGGTSNAQAFTINNPVPTLTSIYPASANAGGVAFTLTVTGTNFISGSVMRWNGADRTTTFVSSTRLTAAITAADVATGGTASVTVFNPTPGAAHRMYRRLPSVLPQARLIPVVVAV